MLKHETERTLDVRREPYSDPLSTRAAAAHTSSWEEYHNVGEFFSRVTLSYK